MNKSEVCVKLTRKNCKKVLGILEMFGEKVFHNTRLSLKDGNHLNEGYPFVYWNGHYWVGSEDDTGKTLIKPRELRNILAKEHLKKGDVGVFGHTNSKYIAKFNNIKAGDIFNCDTYVYINSDRSYSEIITGGGYFHDFLRYATEEEKAILEPKTTIVTLNPVATFTGSIPGQATYTREVWVNHYSDREFYVHYDEQIAYMSIGRRGEGTAVKGTLTYDIPMTKV